MFINLGTICLIMVSVIGVWSTILEQNSEQDFIGKVSDMLNLDANIANIYLSTIKEKEARGHEVLRYEMNKIKIT